MRISGNTNVFLNTNHRSTQKSNAQKAFGAALQEQYATPETKRAASMTAAIEALDKAQENYAPKLSDAQLDWLRGRYDIREMVIDPNIDIYVKENGNISGTWLGPPIMSEAHGRLLDDLHGLGILSDRDKEILNNEFGPPYPLPDRIRNGARDPVTGKRSEEDMELIRRLNAVNDLMFKPNGRYDIVGFHRAVADKHAVLYELLVLEEYRPFNPTGHQYLPPNIAWYRESAEAHSRLADILAQIFG